MKKFIIVLVSIIALAGLMFAEYRFIMCNIAPYHAEDGLLHIDFMGQTDTYYME